MFVFLYIKSCNSNLTITNYCKFVPKDWISIFFLSTAGQMLGLQCMSEATETSSGWCALGTCSWNSWWVPSVNASAEPLPPQQSVCVCVCVCMTLHLNSAYLGTLKHFMKCMHYYTACLCFPVCKDSNIKETPAVVRLT